LSIYEKNRKALKEFMNYHNRRMELKGEIQKEYSVDPFMTVEMLSRLEELKDYLFQG